MLDVLFCSCVPDAVKLVQLHYWPGTPQQPSTAFSFELLDWIEALFFGVPGCFAGCFSSIPIFDGGQSDEQG